MAGGSVLQEPKRSVGVFADINYPEELICRPVAGVVPSGGSAQWSTPGTTVGTANTDANLDFHTYEPRMAGKIDGLDSKGIVEFGITVGVKTSQTTATAKVKLQARNKGGTFVQIDDNGIYGTGFAITATEVEKTFAGYFPTEENFNAVPFDLRLVFQSDNATALAIARVKNSSYVRMNILSGS